MSIFRYKFRALAAVAALAATIYALSSRKPSPVSIATLAQSSAASMGTELRHLSEVLLATPARLAGSDVARLNLICTEGLPGADCLDLDKCLTELDRWAQRVKSETDRHLYRFHQDPSEFDNSEGYFRMLIMAVVVYEDFDVRYNPERISDPTSPEQSDDFFADSRDLFLHG